MQGLGPPEQSDAEERPRVETPAGILRQTALPGRESNPRGPGGKGRGGIRSGPTVDLGHPRMARLPFLACIKATS